MGLPNKLENYGSPKENGFSLIDVLIILSAVIFIVLIGTYIAYKPKS